MSINWRPVPGDWRRDIIEGVVLGSRIKEIVSGRLAFRAVSTASWIAGWEVRTDSQ